MTVIRTGELEGGRSAFVRFSDDGAANTRMVPVIRSVMDRTTIMGEEFRLLHARVHALRQERSLGCIATVSALAGEGKSTISLGLAAVMAAEPGRRILLIECDLRRPSLARELGIIQRPGLREWLNGAIDQVPVRLIDPGGFYFLGAGREPLERPRDLGSPRMAALLQSARDQYDFVIMDATPVLLVADVVLLQDLVDGFLFVVRSRKTPRDAARDALDRIRSDKVLGVVFNDHDEYERSYMSYSYHAYGLRE
jgi:Mrp family chromosome partitioning ATPase